MIRVSSSEPTKLSGTNHPTASAKRAFQVLDEGGMTMLRCSQLIERFGDFNGRITVSNGEISVDGRSMIELLQLAAVTGTVLTVELTGRDSDQVMNRIETIFGKSH